MKLSKMAYRTVVIFALLHDLFSNIFWNELFLNILVYILKTNVCEQ